MLGHPGSPTQGSFQKIHVCIDCMEHEIHTLAYAWWAGSICDVAEG